MADLKKLKKDREEVNKLIKEQNALLAKQNLGSKEYEATITKIVQLEDKKRKVIQQEVALTKQAQPLYKQIEASVKAREKKIQSLKTMAQDDVSYAGQLNQLSAKQFTNQTGLYDLIKNRVSKEGELSKSSAAQLETLDSLAMGTNDIAGLQNEIAQSKLREGKLRGPLMEGVRGQEQSLQNILQNEIEILELKKQQAAEQELNNEIFSQLDNLTGGMASKAKNFADKLKIATPQEAAFLVATAALTSWLFLTAKFSEMLDKIGETFGSLDVMGKDFQDTLADSSVEAATLGGGIQDVANITNTLASNFGMNVDEAAKLSSKVFDTSKAIGLSADEGANLFGVLMQTADLSADQAEQLAEGAFQLARQAGVAPSAVMKDIAASSEVVATFTKDGGDNIAQAAVQARALGVSLNDTAKIAEGLLDFESSLTKEVEASVLIGRQLNLQKAREAALNNDIAGAMEEVVKQMGSEEEFNKLNAIQRKALADSIGVSVGQLSKFVGEQGKAASLSDMMSKQAPFEDLVGEEALSSLTQLMGSMKAIGAELLNVLGPALNAIAGVFANLAGFMKENVVLMGLLKIAAAALGFKLLFMGISALWSGAFAALAWIPVVGPALALAAATAGTVAILGAVGKTMVGDLQYDAMNGALQTSSNEGAIVGVPGKGIFQGTRNDSVQMGRIEKPQSQVPVTSQPMMSDNSSNQVLNKLTAAVDGLVNKGVGIKGEFSNFDKAVNFSNDRKFGVVTPITAGGLQ